MSDGGFPITIPRQEPLTGGRLVRRYKRFLADVELPGGEVVTAHCVNTGAMEGLTAPGNRVWISRAANPNRKLKWTWELVETPQGVFGANTGMPNAIVGQLLRERLLPWLAAWDELRPEQRYGANSRIDFWMRRGRKETFLEVKNCHLIYPDGRAYFPDSVSARATGHLRELMEVAQQGHRAHVLFFCQIPGVRSIRPSDVHDPEFAAAAREAKAAGVGFSAIALSHTPDKIVVERRVPVDMRPYRTERVMRWKNENKTRPQP